MSIDSDMGSGAGPVQGPGPTAPTPQEEAQARDVLAQLLISSISQSSQTQVQNYFAVDNPELIPPLDIGTLLAAAVHQNEARQISSLLDRWNEQVKEDGERLRELQKTEDQERKIEQRDIELRQMVLDGISYYWRNRANEEFDNLVVPALVASFVISSGFIGDAAPMVDVASTEMVAVNPIMSSNVQITPQLVQDTFNLTINLFATQIAYISNAEAIAKSLNEPANHKATDLETARAYARNVIGNVKSNEINAFLMGILVNKFDQADSVNNQRFVNQLATMTKATMIAVALAALYQVETGWMTAAEFNDLLDGKMEPRTKEEATLVNLMKEALEGLPEEQSQNLRQALCDWIGSKPSVENMLDPVKAYSGVVTHLQPPEQRG